MEYYVDDKGRKVFQFNNKINQEEQSIDLHLNNKKEVKEFIEENAIINIKSNKSIFFCETCNIEMKDSNGYI